MGWQAPTSHTTTKGGQPGRACATKTPAVCARTKVEGVREEGVEPGCLAVLLPQAWEGGQDVLVGGRGVIVRHGVRHKGRVVANALVERRDAVLAA